MLVGVYHRMISSSFGHAVFTKPSTKPSHIGGTPHFFNISSYAPSAHLGAAQSSSPPSISPQRGGKAANCSSMYEGNFMSSVTVGTPNPLSLEPLASSSLLLKSSLGSQKSNSPLKASTSMPATTISLKSLRPIWLNTLRRVS
jgi:hypothetical protein